MDFLETELNNARALRQALAELFAPLDIACDEIRALGETLESKRWQRSTAATREVRAEVDRLLQQIRKSRSLEPKLVEAVSKIENAFGQVVATREREHAYHEIDAMLSGSGPVDSARVFKAFVHM